MSTIITAIDRHSPAERAGIQVGEQLLTINGHTIVDVLDYRFYGYDALSHVELKTAAGEVRHVTIRKAEGQDLGLNFDTYLMDEMRFCANHCIFCFVDQMPPGMRSTLYFKDDDARLSFLLGNLITLTNLTEREAQRIIDLHISPINVSVHATDPQLHCTMLGNKNAARSLDYIQTFCKAGIVMNGQIVVCPGWNDGDQLRRTLRDLTEWEFSSCSSCRWASPSTARVWRSCGPWTPTARGTSSPSPRSSGRRTCAASAPGGSSAPTSCSSGRAWRCRRRTTTRATASWKTAWACCARWSRTSHRHAHGGAR